MNSNWLCRLPSTRLSSIQEWKLLALRTHNYSLSWFLPLRPFKQRKPVRYAAKCPSPSSLLRSQRRTHGSRFLYFGFSLLFIFICNFFFFFVHLCLKRAQLGSKNGFAQYEREQTVANVFSWKYLDMGSRRKKTKCNAHNNCKRLVPSATTCWIELALLYIDQDAIIFFPSLFSLSLQLPFFLLLLSFNSFVLRHQASIIHPSVRHEGTLSIYFIQVSCSLADIF